MADSNDIPDEYKATELGVLPKEWRISKLESVAQIIMGQSPPGITYNEKGHGKPFLQGKAEFGEVNPKNIKYTTDPKKIAPGGSVLMSVRAPVGDVNIADIEYCIGRGLAAISLMKGDNQFLFFLLQYLKDEIEKEGTGSIFKSINKAKLSEFDIPLPPLPEQHAIAATLRTVQEAKEKTDAMIAATKALKAAMMKHLFTYGPVPLEEAERVILKDTEIGQMAEGWKNIKLEDIVRLTITDGVHKTPKYTETGIPFISAINMENDTLNFLNCRCISEEDHKKLIQRCHPEQNDSLLCKVGATIGKVAKIDVKFPFSIFVQIALIKPDLQKINPDFLKYALISEKGQSQILKNASQSTMPFIGTNKIGKILIPYPDIQIQEKIGIILITIDQKLAAEQSRKEALDTLFTSLLHDLMTAKIRVTPIAV